MNLFNLVNLIDKKISPLRIEANLCPQTISPKSNCHKCLDVCPKKSITISHGKIEMDDSCINCGLCSTVCPTNAIYAEKPSFLEILNETARKCKNKSDVYIQCQNKRSTLSSSSTVTVRCFGAIPREGWLTLLNDYDHLSIYCTKDQCEQCEVTSGYHIWKKELGAAETMSGKSMNIVDDVRSKRNETVYDEERRELFALLAGEIKTVNKLLLREVIGEKKVPSYKEKLHEDSIEKVRKEWETVSATLLEKLTNEAVSPFMKKRKLLIENVEKDANLQERQDIHLPVIGEGCDFCGACSLLCPTDALIQESNNSQTTITLHPEKCVDCKLCEEICFSRHIKLTPTSNKLLLTETVPLAVKCERTIIH